MKRLVRLAPAVAVGLLSLIPIGGGAMPIPAGPKGKHMDFTAYPADRPKAQLDLLFIHHSVGGQWLADPGAFVEHNGAEIHATTHPNGGGLRRLLTSQGYRVHEASYGSAIGDRTDLFDWLPKFRNEMPRILATDLQNQPLQEGRRNRIVMFKSCYPNNKFDSNEPSVEGGDARGPALTQANARATMRGLLDVFSEQPDVLFVYVTAPPLAHRDRPERAYKWLVKKALGLPNDNELAVIAATQARAFHDWAKDPERGWLAEYPLRNVVVFDYFDELTDHGASNFARYPSGDGTDSHPNTTGQQRAAKAFVPWLNRAVARAGLAQ